MQAGASECVPIVPRPPILILPKRLNGTLHVTMFGVTLRMTITSDGFAGTSFSMVIEVQARHK